MEQPHRRGTKRLHRGWHSTLRPHRRFARQFATVAYGHRGRQALLGNRKTQRETENLPRIHRESQVGFYDVV